MNSEKLAYVRHSAGPVLSQRCEVKGRTGEGDAHGSVGLVKPSGLSGISTEC